MVSSEDQIEKTDQVLELLTKPLTRYILSVLAGVNPGKFKGEMDAQNDEITDE